MARPYWSGQIQISLVTFGVKLFPAVEAKSEIRFHQISKKTGERVRQIFSPIPRQLIHAAFIDRLVCGWPTMRGCVSIARCGHAISLSSLVRRRQQVGRRLAHPFRPRLRSPAPTSR